MAGKASAKDFFENLDRPAIVEAIRRAEAKGIGEIRVHLHHGRVADVRKAAEATFLKLGMNRTAHRTGCLIFIAPDERSFAVIGDEAVHEKVGDAFWHAARDAAAARFAEGRFAEGIVAAVDRIGDVLAEHFPKPPGEKDVDELPNELSEGGKP
jgi:uncharacterized membrane protein